MLTAEGAKFLDPDGDLAAGIPFCPPEGDAGTGMAATNSVTKFTGNVSAGTSIFSMVVLDGDQPSAIRAVVNDEELRREVMLSLLEAEDFNGPKELVETIERELDLDAALKGNLERTEESGTLDALPESWREVLAEARFRSAR